MLKTQVIGNLGKDAVVRETNGNIALNFSVAHNERVVTGDGEVFDRTSDDSFIVGYWKSRHCDGEVFDRTIWVNCTRWLKKRGELHKYLNKGTLVHVAGSPSVKIFRNKDGVMDVDFRLKVDSIELLSKGKDEPAASEKTDVEKEKEVMDAFES